MIDKVVEMVADEYILGRLLGPGCGGSENRAFVMIELLNGAKNDEEFWKIFQLGWSISEKTWQYRVEIKRHLDQRPSAGAYIEKADKAFYDSLPELVTVYRGCSFPRIRGLAWTTDRGVAESFARGHRQIAVPMAVVAHGKVPKEAIYTVATGRKEAEVVLNWRRLREVGFTRFEKVQV